MVTTVQKIIGPTGDYSAPQSWEDAAPSDLTLTRSSMTLIGSTSSTIVLDAGASATNDFYTGHPVWADARPSEIRLIVSYNGTSKVATIGAFNGSSATWGTTPSIENYTIDCVIWMGLLQKALFSDAPITFAGSTSSATCYKILQCYAGASFMDDAGILTNALAYDSTKGAAITSSVNYTHVISLTEDYARVYGIQAKSTNNSAYAVWGDTGNVGRLVSNCILEALSSVIVLYGDTNLIVNSLCVSTNTSSVSTMAYLTNGCSAYGCTFVSVGCRAAQGIYGSISFGLLVDCAVYNCKSAYGNFPPNAIGSVTDADIRPTGLTYLRYDTTAGSGFKSITPGSYDFGLRLTSSLAGARSNLYGYGVTTDIRGTSRPSGVNSIGCAEFLLTGTVSWDCTPSVVPPMQGEDEAWVVVAFPSSSGGTPASAGSASGFTLRTSESGTTNQEFMALYTRDGLNEADNFNISTSLTVPNRANFSTAALAILKSPTVQPELVMQQGPIYNSLAPYVVIDGHTTQPAEPGTSLFVFAIDRNSTFNSPLAPITAYSNLERLVFTTDKLHGSSAIIRTALFHLKANSSTKQETLNFFYESINVPVFAIFSFYTQELVASSFTTATSSSSDGGGLITPMVLPAPSLAGVAGHTYYLDLICLGWSDDGTNALGLSLPAGYTLILQDQNGGDFSGFIMGYKITSAPDVSSRTVSITSSGWTNPAWSAIRGILQFQSAAAAHGFRLIK